MKRCVKCFHLKPFPEFYNNPNNKDGKSCKCITCTRTDQRIYDKAHKQQKLDYLAKKRQESLHTKVLNNHRALLWRAVKLKCVCNSKTLERQIGCNLMTLRHHLEDLFTRGMSWDNYGNDGWVVDHIKPCSSFNLRFKKYQKICFHYSNLQPMWYFENQKKGANES